MLGKLFGVGIGGAIIAFSGYVAYSLVNMIIQGVATGSWLMVIAGGILAYLFLGLSIAGIAIGGIIIISALAE